MVTRGGDCREGVCSSQKYAEVREQYSGCAHSTDGTVLITQDLALENYLEKSLLSLSLQRAQLLIYSKQVSSKRSAFTLTRNRPTRGVAWLLTGAVTHLVVAIITKDSRTPLERWVFDINLVGTVKQYVC